MVLEMSDLQLLFNNNVHTTVQTPPQQWEIVKTTSVPWPTTPTLIGNNQNNQQQQVVQQQVVQQLPETLTVKMTDLQFLLDQAEKSSVVGQHPQEEWAIRNLASQVRPTQAAPSEAVTVRTSDLQNLFHQVINRQEFATPSTGPWKPFRATSRLPENKPSVELGSIRALKAHVSDIIEEQEEKIQDKGFMTPKEKELMTELKKKEETLEDMVEELERQPKAGDRPRVIPQDSRFNPGDFDSPAEGAWDYRQAFIDFMKKRIQAARATSSPLPPLQPLALVTDELVYALQSSDFEPPEGGAWDFKSAAELVKRLRIRPDELGSGFPRPLPASPTADTLTEELGEAHIRGLVRLHMQQGNNGQQDDEIRDLPEYSDEDYYEDDYSSSSSIEEGEFKKKPGKVTLVHNATGRVYFPALTMNK